MHSTVRRDTHNNQASRISRRRESVVSSAETPARCGFSSQRRPRGCGGSVPAPRPCLKAPLLTRHWCCSLCMCALFSGNSQAGSIRVDCNSAAQLAVSSVLLGLLALFASRAAQL